ncbi:hypothetical protein [Psychrobacillus sp. FSL H8-0510]|uniref:hypothetical protein n=1 Tax=Psychrobacillus sp. FSL H8-0510 TaxID=2921394 RepID=UPI0030F5BF79
MITMSALAYTFWSMTDWSDAYEHVPSGATVFIEDTQIPAEINWTGDQVVAKLYRLSDENTPIVVNGQLFLTDLDVKKFQSTVSLQGLYKQTLEWDATGKAHKIIFTQI